MRSPRSGPYSRSYGYGEIVGNVIFWIVVAAIVIGVVGSIGYAVVATAPGSCDGPNGCGTSPYYSRAGGS